MPSRSRSLMTQSLLHRRRIPWRRKRLLGRCARSFVQVRSQQSARLSTSFTMMMHETS